MCNFHYEEAMWHVTSGRGSNASPGWRKLLLQSNTGLKLSSKPLCYFRNTKVIIKGIGQEWREVLRVSHTHTTKLNNENKHHAVITFFKVIASISFSGTKRFSLNLCSGERYQSKKCLDQKKDNFYLRHVSQIWVNVVTKKLRDWLRLCLYYIKLIIKYLQNPE